MSNKKLKPIDVGLDPHPKGNFKALGGAEHDEWNKWLASKTSYALLVNEASATQAAVAVASGMIDMKPADPIEGILISQIMAANQASLSMYQRAWAQQNVEAQTKYLALADKASRSVMMLTERLDQHRGRGQQQITVKHITVNADQALVTDQVVTGKTDRISPLLLKAITEKPMPIPMPMEIEPEVVGRMGEKEE